MKKGGKIDISMRRRLVTERMTGGRENEIEKEIRIAKYSEVKEIREGWR